MISAAGLMVGCHLKPFLKERVENNILYGDLTTLLYAQGYGEFNTCFFHIVRGVSLCCNFLLG
ncbi:MAG: hypothetical protein GY799_18165 [Desulfobulbaceae bacterium]|nr:hypothetical protein [Desulfobulbaceae bacterium]